MEKLARSMGLVKINDIKNFNFLILNMVDIQQLYSELIGLNLKEGEVLAKTIDSNYSNEIMNEVTKIIKVTEDPTKTHKSNLFLRVVKENDTELLYEETYCSHRLNVAINNGKISEIDGFY